VTPGVVSVAIATGAAAELRPLAAILAAAAAAAWLE
jgi:hypothetical protein